MTESPTAPRVNRFLLWFGFLGGAVAWLTHLIALSVTAEWGCFAGLHHWTWLGLTSVAWLVIAASVVLVLVAIAATCSAWLAGRRLDDPSIHDPRGTEAFMARAGLLTSGVFVLIIVVETLPILFFLQHCW